MIADPELLTADPELFIADLELFVADPELFITDPELFVADPELFIADYYETTDKSDHFYLYFAHVLLLFFKNYALEKL